MELQVPEDTIIYAMITTRAELLVTNTHYKLKGIQYDPKHFGPNPPNTADCSAQAKRCSISVQLLCAFRVVQSNHRVSVNINISEYLSL